ncbi:hypothetical protein [Larkinella soli]|nr:hypothetical protein [Larkinella soli]
MSTTDFIVLFFLGGIVLTYIKIKRLFGQESDYLSDDSDGDGDADGDD